MSTPALSFIREETRKRCQIVELDPKLERQFLPVNPESFHLLYETEGVDFTVYFRIENHMIEFMKKEEFSKDLLDQIWSALKGSTRQVQIAIRKADKVAFDQMVESVKKKKIEQLVETDPNLDRKTLDLFSNLSSASQLIVRGGITNEVVDQVEASAAHLVSNIVDSDMAVATLSRMVTHDPTLYDHSATVAMIAGMIATHCLEKPLKQKEAQLVAQCGLYHDVGKTCVPSRILNKPGKFTDEEFAIMKQHAELGEEELGKVIEGGAPINPIAARVAGEHHERFCGGGYPRGRAGRAEDDETNGIHLFTRIVTIADVYSALLMKRVYKPAYEAQDAIKIMADVAEREYDPDIFSKFVRQVVTSLNTYQEKVAGKDKGRLLFFDGTGKLREQRKKVI